MVDNDSDSLTLVKTGFSKWHHLSSFGDTWGRLNKHSRQDDPQFIAVQESSEGQRRVGYFGIRLLKTVDAKICIIFFQQQLLLHEVAKNHERTVSKSQPTTKR